MQPFIFLNIFHMLAARRIVIPWKERLNIEGKMKRLILLFIAFNLTIYAQSNVGLNTPEMSLPDSLLGKKSLSIYIDFIIDENCKIINYYISAIFKSWGAGLKKYAFIYRSYYSKNNTKEGSEIVKILQPWLKEFAEKTFYVKTSDWKDIKAVNGFPFQKSIEIRYGPRPTTKKSDSLNSSSHPDFFP